MLIASDASTFGRLGYSFVASEGSHRDVARRLADMLQYTRICEGCLLSEWRDGMTPEEAAAGLKRALHKCDAFCSSCALGDEGCEHTGQHWTQRRCRCCVDRGIDCITLYVLGSSMDNGGNQASLIKRVFEGTYEDDEGGPHLYDMCVMCDGVHFNKSLDSCVRLHKIWLDGWLCGTFQLWSRYLDADPEIRAAVRTCLTRELLRAKNAFSIEQAVARRERRLLNVLLTTAERAAEHAWLVSTLGPCIDRLWRENTEGMYGRPMGVVYHNKSNLIFYVDVDMSQLRVLKLSHTPCDNAPVTASRGASMRAPVGLVLLGEHAFITDACLDSPAIWVVNLAHVTARFNAAAEEAEPSEAGSSAAANASATTNLRSLELVGGPQLCEPYGIAADGDELYVADRGAKRVLCLTLGHGAGSKSAVVSEVTMLPEAPTGITVLPSEHGRLVVATTSAIYLLSTADGSRQTIVRLNGADFCGVAIAPPALGGDLYAISSGKNAVMRFRSSSGNASLFDTAFEMLVGGWESRPSAEAALFEGTASKYRLWRPTFGCFARNAFVFMNSGHGKFGKVLLLNDARPFALRLLPAMLHTADAFCLTADTEHHAVNRAHTALMLEELRDLMDHIEETNHTNYQVARGLQGERGNFSNIVRRSCRQLPTQLLSQCSTVASLGAPRRCMIALSPKATLTLVVENSFVGQRKQWSMPYVLQYADQHAINEDMDVRRTGGSDAYCHYTGSRPNRDHYSQAGIRAAPQRFQLAKKAPRGREKGDECKKALTVLQCAARLFLKAQQGCVTDKAKEAVGSKPAVAYARRLAPSSTIEAADAHGLPSFFGCSSSSAGPSARAAPSHRGAPREEVMYRPWTLIFIRGQCRRLEIAELTQSVTQFVYGDGEVRISRQRIACRYFVETSEILQWAAAKAYWAAHGITTAADIDRCMSERDGVPFSFFSTDTVAHSAILCAVPACFQRERHERNLVSFSLALEDLQDGRELMSGGADLPLDDAGDVEALRAEALRVEAAATAAAAEEAAREAAFEMRQLRRHTVRDQQLAAQEAQSAARRQAQGKRKQHI